MIVGAFLSAAFFLITTSQRDRERNDLLENERFMASKVSWLFYGVRPNKIWSVGPVIYVQRPNGSYYALSSSNGTLQLAPATDTNGDSIPDAYSGGVKLNNNHASVISPQLTVAMVNGQKAVQIQLSLQGKNETRSFVRTEYAQ